MDEQTKRAIKKTVLSLRRLLEREDIPAVLKQHGIFPDGRRVLVEKLAVLDDRGKERREHLEAAIDREVHAVHGDQKAGIGRYVREVAFTYLNRLVALRSMEVRGLIDECIRTRDDYAGRSLRHHRFIREYAGTQFDAEDTDSLKAFLRSVFRELHEDITILFDPDDEYSIIMPSLQALRECIRALNEDIPEYAFKEPELIGWVYQYFQTEEKNRVFEEVRTQKKKIEGDDIVPATSLYTERYMVDYLVQNSLGLIWMEMYPDSKLCENWPYFVKDQDLKPREPRPIKSITFLDPACGSGHFLLVAFGLLVQMYEEEARLASEGKIPKEWAVPEEQVATAILESNLHGIDIDLRSVQLSWLVLYLRLREHQKSVGASKMLPAKVNLVAADASLLDTPEFLSWCEERFKDETYAFNIIKGVVGRLRNLSEIGSLARPEKDLKELIHKEKERLRSALMKDEKQTLLKFFIQEEQKELIIEDITDDQFWHGVLNQVTKALDDYYREAAVCGDTRAQILMHDANRGFKFLELCNKRYDVVATNPPYMGSKNMGEYIKQYLQSVYPKGKRDIYAAFICRNREWIMERGIVAMVTQQSWMFLPIFVKIREEILKVNCVQTLAHLGTRAFGEISGEVVNTVLFTLANEKSEEKHRMVAFRLIARKGPAEKNRFLKQAIRGQIPEFITKPLQRQLTAIPDSPIVYWGRPLFLEILCGNRRLRHLADVKQGLATGDNDRFLRYFWETIFPRSQWVSYAKGGGYSRWLGFREWVVDWRDKGNPIRRHPGSRFQNEQFYHRSGWSYSQVAQGSFAVRMLEDAVFDVKGSSIFFRESNETSVVALLQTRPVTYFLRCLRPMLEFKEGTVANIPLPEQLSISSDTVKASLDIKKNILLCELIDPKFENQCFSYEPGMDLKKLSRLACATIERFYAFESTLVGFMDYRGFCDYGITGSDLQEVLDETGTPADWHPLIMGYEAIPKIDVCKVPKVVIEYLKEHQRIHPSLEVLTRIKSRLCSLYEAGPGAKVEDVLDEECESETLISKRIPIPTETFLEELSVKMEINPISIYWLLKELREQEGLVCWPECKRYVEDYFTVIILRMLGYRWPKQVEANEPVPDWADQDGIIPITEHTDEKTLFERIRDRIGAEFGEDKISDIEAEFADILYNAASKVAELKGKNPPKKKVTLAQWLEKEFFKRHTSQFKKRPIAWHLKSSNGTFQVLLFYHKLSQDMLKNLKNKYLARVQSYYSMLLERARRGESVPGGLTAGKLSDIQSELEEFANKLDEIINMPYEPLIDDGVRVNIAPLQKVGLLASPVLAAKDIGRAIADRNRWRDDDKEQNTVWGL